MDTTKLINYLGYTSIYKPFDDYLLSIGIKKRPKGTSLKTRFLTQDNLTLGFIEYDDYIEDYQIEPLSEGTLILERVDFEAGFEPQLPFGLDFKFSLKETLSNLSPALKLVVDGLEPISEWSPRFFHQSFFLNINFDKKLDQINHINVSKPDRYNKKHFGLK
jgi:hypothetical protein